MQTRDTSPVLSVGGSSAPPVRDRGPEGNQGGIGMSGERCNPGVMEVTEDVASPLVDEHSFTS